MQSMGTSQSPSSTPTQPLHEARRVSMATTVRPARLRQYSSAPYQAEECVVSTLARAGAAPSLSRDPDTRAGCPSAAQGNRGRPHFCIPPAPPNPPPATSRFFGALESVATATSFPPPSMMLPRCPAGDRRLSGCRLGHLTRIGTGVGRWKSPGESIRAVEGARSQRCVARDNADSATTRTPRHACLPSLLRPIPGLGQEEETPGLCS